MRPRVRPSRLAGFLRSVAVAVLIGSAGAESRADVILKIQNSVGVVGARNSLDVVLMNVGDEAVEFDVDRFEFGIGPFLEPELTFTAVLTATGNEYIFGRNSTKGPDIATAVGASASAADTFKPAGAVVSRTVKPGDTLDLGRAFYTLGDGPLLPNSIDIDFDVAATGIFLNGRSILVDEFVGGTITVVRGGTVPEPSSLALGFVAVAGLALASGRRPGVGG